jgi:hypothetical protein
MKEKKKIITQCVLHGAQIIMLRSIVVLESIPRDLRLDLTPFAVLYAIIPLFAVFYSTLWYALFGTALVHALVLLSEQWSIRFRVYMQFKRLSVIY